MKSVLISIQPKWCELIASGKKTVEVRKTAPKEVPFKAYIYCTKKKPNMVSKIIDGCFTIYNGYIIGEFICDKVVKYEEHIEEGGLYYTLKNDFNEACQLDNWELHDYGKGKPLYAWHISELKIYDEPKELGEFTKPCPYGLSECMYDDRPKCYDCNRTITRPPQSWCYVENS